MGNGLIDNLWNDNLCIHNLQTKKTFLKVNFKVFKYNGKYLEDIAVVGFQPRWSDNDVCSIYILNIFASKAGGDAGVATFTSAGE